MDAARIFEIQGDLMVTWYSTVFCKALNPVN